MYPTKIVGSVPSYFVQLLRSNLTSWLVQTSGKPFLISEYQVAKTMFELRLAQKTVRGTQFKDGRALKVIFRWLRDTLCIKFEHSPSPTMDLDVKATNWALFVSQDLTYEEFVSKEI
ncbi:hypothetical protein FCV25MIE_24773 [Fagus crenata]